VPAAAGAAAPVEEKTEFDVILSRRRRKKINVIKVVRAHTGLGLKKLKILLTALLNLLKKVSLKTKLKNLKKNLKKPALQ
jgi:large subunit ribosomal protein L7/L12